MNVRLDLAELLPGLPSAEDACAHRLAGSLKGGAGIRRVHVAEEDSGRSVCVHYAEERISEGRIAEIARTLAAQLTRCIGHVRWHLTGRLAPPLLEEAARLLRIQTGVLEARVENARHLCAEYLRDRTSAHALQGASPEGASPEKDTSAQLCIHYDPAVLSLPRIRQVARRAGVRLTDRYGHVLWAVEGLRHQRRARTVAGHLKQMQGILEAEANAGGPIRIEFDRMSVSEAVLQSTLQSMGVRVAGAASSKRAGRGGVLVKGGGPLENLGTLTAIAFDKTGTLTEGEPKLTDVVPLDGQSEEALLRTAVAVEKLSDHPLAEAVVRYGTERLDGRALDEAHDLESITGRGVRAKLGGDDVFIGKDDLFAEVEGLPLPEGIRKAVERLEKDGRTTMIVRRGDAYLGVIGLMDPPREAAAPVMKRLREIGIERMVMISGDNQRVAESVGRAVGLDEARGDLLPSGKVETIKRLRAEKVAMVGDGVNDAPAMANATVGIAMGAAGSDVALETAAVALMADDLMHLPFAVGLSRQTSRIIRQNLWMSLGMVAFLVPATVFGLGIGPAVALHEGSTLVVVFNALRLLAYSTD